MRRCTVFELSEIPYDEALSFQFELMERIRGKKGKESFLILLEHTPVITIGKNGNRKNILVSEETLKRKGIIIRHIDRGGDVTYHGPGQLVGYPIISLPYYKKSIREYVHLLEDCLIKTVDAFGIKAGRNSKNIGVWVNQDENGADAEGEAKRNASKHGAYSEPQKIGFIGVRISRGITYHGFSLNVNPDLAAFKYINPCGMNGCQITSIKELTNEKISVAEVTREFISCYGKLFNLRSVVVKTHLSYIPKVIDNA